MRHISERKSSERTVIRTNSAVDGGLLPRVNEPADIKKFNYDELERLADEIRAVIIETVTKNGGHLASNLGVVELTLALHRVFESPGDKIVWDVGHQCYAHKLLTGRAGVFCSLRRQGGLAGFPKREESPHDAFNTGHASTSISAALGLLAGAALRRDAFHRAVAVIGDGALTGGLAYEALSHAGQLGLPLIVVLNDNRMSIGPNVGSLSRYLSRLSMKSHYQYFRQAFDNLVKQIPHIGGRLHEIVVRLKRAVKAVFYIDNFFVDLGFEYVGPVDGHNIQHLEQVFEDVRKLGHPVVVHVLTRKGKGGGPAENDPGAFHGVEGAAGKAAHDTPGGVFYGTFTSAFSQAALEAARKDSRVCAVTAAMEKGTGLSTFKKEFPARFFDAGIAEGHAVTFAAGLAAAGLHPIAAVYSTFIQRACDHVIHDTAAQNLPVVFAVDRAGLVAGDGETHQGVFDISIFRAVPNLRLLAPASGAELALMLDWALAQNFPVMIRYPKARALEYAAGEGAAGSPPAITEGRGIYLNKAEAAVCLAFTGGLYEEALGAKKLLLESGIDCALYNLRFLNNIDEDYLEAQINKFETFAVLEEGGIQGGAGEYVQALASRKNCKTRVITAGVPREFIPQGNRDELLDYCGLSCKKIARLICGAADKKF